ncbi:cell wall-binding repeat-containing protein [Alkalihalobacillus sp. CinArs1]|uniref:cell wall-binding repeat-containing protein n=1 Tax=Alkalihalobacillus sp. CinArs1 TaxID=2995314 RepID=UPI0022DE51FA|nr:cell wall-binding repeat-containing protein [Alkalihalobacillus sp. CinArs1]
MKVFTSLLAGILALSLSVQHVEAAEDHVSVRLVNFIKNKTEVSFNVNGSYHVDGSEINIQSNDGNQFKVKAESGDVVLYKGNSKLGNFGDSMTLVPTITGAKDSYIELGDKSYLGEIEMTVEGNYIRPINTLPMEDYLKGVVPSEMMPYWGDHGGQEALKAQAVAARTFAKVDMLNQEANPDRYPFTDTTMSQVYKGMHWYDTTNRAVDETAGKVLKYANSKGELDYIGAFYSSSNGGRVLSNTNAWGSALVPYLQGKEDPYDDKITTSSDLWSYTLGKEQIDTTKLDLKKPESWWDNVTELGTDATEIQTIKSRLVSKYGFSSKDEIKITKINDISFTLPPFNSNDVLKGSLSFSYFIKQEDGFVMEDGKIKEHTKEINDTSYNIRFMIGTSIMKGPYVKKIDNKADSFTVYGSGFGHGIGMSQYGAYQQSKEGRTYDQILDFYYTDTKLVQEGTVVSSERLSGLDRYGTSVAVSQYGWKNQSDVAVIGRGDVAIDALTGSVLAKKYNAPLLLTPSNQLDERVEAELNRLKPQKIYILGGTGAVSESIEGTLRGKAYVQEVERVSGKDRYETAVEVAEEVGNYNQAILASGNDSSPDALSIASYAAASQVPILLTPESKISTPTDNYLQTVNVKKATLIGGKGVISNNIEAELKEDGLTVDRVSGKDRYETSVEIARTYDFAASNVFFANGDVFIDALPGSSLAAAMQAPVLLTQKDTLPKSVDSYLKGSHSTNVYLLGGKGAISNSTVDSIEKSLN